MYIRTQRALAVGVSENREVIQEWYGIVSQCNILTILEDGDEK